MIKHGHDTMYTSLKTCTNKAARRVYLEYLSYKIKVICNIVHTYQCPAAGCSPLQMTWSWFYIAGVQHCSP